MLKGYIKCSEIGKYVLPYINLELNRKEMHRVAQHLRNCPKCMEKYTGIKKRKKELELKSIEIEKKLRMQTEISAYMDKEADNETKFIVEGMLLYSSEYKKELIENEKLKIYLKEARKNITENLKTKFSDKIIAKIKLKRKNRKKLLNRLSQLFLPLLHVPAKFQ